YRSRPRVARVPMGKRSQRIPYDIVSLRETCHWSFTKKLYCQFRVVFLLSSNGRKLFWTDVLRPSRKSAKLLNWLVDVPGNAVAPPPKLKTPALAPVSKRVRP